jgi:chromosome partitioning protein
MKKKATMNLKGGVGKSTVTINLCYELARTGKNVLLIDADTQENATDFLFGPDRKFPATLYDFMIDPRSIKFAQTIQPYAGPNATRASLQLPGRFDIVPGHPGLGFVSEEFARNRIGQPVAFVHDTLDYGLIQVENEYDYCIVDPGPNWGPVTDAVLKAVSGIIVPFMPAPMTFLSFRRLLQTLAESNARIARQRQQTTIHGIVFTMCHSAKQRQVAGALKGNFTQKGIRSFGPILNFCDAMMDMVQTQLPLGAYLKEHPEILTNGDLTKADAQAVVDLAHEFIEITQ